MKKLFLAFNLSVLMALSACATGGAGPTAGADKKSCCEKDCKSCCKGHCEAKNGKCCEAGDGCEMKD